MWRIALALLIAGTAGAAPVVLSVDRLYRSGNADLAEAGEILLTELHCVNCHERGGRLSERIPLVPGPHVANSFAKFRHGFLEKWLANPHGMKSGTRMPNVLATIPAPERKQVAKALTEFIQTLPSKLQGGGKVPAGDIQHGRELFHSIGCIACHAPRSDFKKTATGEEVDSSAVSPVAVPLGKLVDKYTWSSLNRFLELPHDDRPFTRMPRFQMSDDERRDVTWYLMNEEPTDKPLNRTGQLTLIEEGRKHFTSLGCANCHHAFDGKAKAESTLTAKPLAELKSNGGCLTGAGQAPRFNLDAFQRQALTAALKGITQRPALTAAQRVHRKMVALNCYACHERNGRGGPDEERLKYFVSSASDLGDEGRVPPMLTGVGRKLKHAAIRGIVAGQMKARPYMTTRMPAFEGSDAKFLADGFGKADHDPTEKPTARDGEEFQVGRNMWGRHLLGIKGLSCITCHQLRNHKSLGIQAMDLAHSADRLRPEWFRDYLINPAKFRPGTRMPSFWPNGKPMVKGNGSSTARQIDSIWVYLNELDQSRLPVGLIKTNDLLLKPGEKPIVFRTFMEDAGMHAVAVGYPSATHAAFDSQNPRWAMAWTGKFLDAESTWDDRFTPLAKPEGTNVIAIQPNPPVHEKNNVARFAGYQLHLRTGHPIFHYKVGGESFTDVLLPDSTVGKRMTRTLAKKSGQSAKWIEVANGKTIVKSGEHWTVDKQLKVNTRNPARVLTTADGNHLQVRVSDRSTVIYEW